MADGALSVLDGSLLRSLTVSLPDSSTTFTRPQVMELAESKVSSALFGLTLPENLKAAALNRADADVSFRSDELGREQAAKFVNDYVCAIADELKDDPLVVSVLDGSTLKLILDDEDDFAMLAENVFTDLDIEDKGKISKSEIRNALVHMGVEMGVPPFSEFPLVNDILTKHGSDGKEDLGQAQFAEALLPVLQDLADALAEKPVVYIQNVKIINGSKLKKVLINEKQMNDLVDRIWNETQQRKDEYGCREIVKSFLEKNGKELGLPPSEANEAVSLLYDAIFADVDKVKGKAELEKSEFAELVKQILEKFSEQLEANPVYQDLDN